MEEVRHFIVREHCLTISLIPYFVVLIVSANLVSIHADHGHFYGTCKVKVVVAKMISCGLKGVLINSSCIIGYSEKDWLGCCYSCFVRH